MQKHMGMGPSQKLDTTEEEKKVSHRVSKYELRVETYGVWGHHKSQMQLKNKQGEPSYI